jgi:UDP-N-acetylmuramoyl-tripeptide--D-alanyl-D-alanine ligase
LIALTLDEVARLADGRLERSSGAAEVTGVTIDSRRVQAGDLFVAVGRGAEFCGDALARGAAATLVPADAFAALAALAREVRSRSGARILGITGSTGKTSTKDILAALCRPHRRTVAAEASYNNELGVPLTLCRLDADTEVCILELAMRGLGQIAELAEIARPQIGLVTSVGPVHLELVGTLDAVAQAKTELIDALPADGVAIVPAGVPELDSRLRRDLDVRTFGRGGDATVEEIRIKGGRAHVRFDLRGTPLELTFNFTARHHASNALAALLAYEALGLPLDQAQQGAEEIAFSPWRGEELPLPGGGLLINDAYNANPVSMRAALDTLVDRSQGRRRVAVLGDMAELGPDGPAYHREVGSYASTAGVDALLTVGTLAHAYAESQVEIPVVRSVETVDEAIAALEDLLEPGDCVLVKASRAVGLERLAEAFAALPA